MTLEAAVRDLKEGLEGMGFRDADFRQSNWIRLKVLSRLREDGLLDEKLRWAPAGRNGR
jgi:hypothetical protein